MKRTGGGQCSRRTLHPRMLTKNLAVRWDEGHRPAQMAHRSDRVRLRDEPPCDGADYAICNQLSYVRGGNTGSIRDLPRSENFGHFGRRRAN